LLLLSSRHQLHPVIIPAPFCKTTGSSKLTNIKCADGIAMVKKIGIWRV